MLDGVDTNATVILYGNDAFTITLTQGQSPIINRKNTNNNNNNQNNGTNTIGAPTTGIFTADKNHTTEDILLTSFIASILTALAATIIIKKRANQQQA